VSGTFLAQGHSPERGVCASNHACCWPKRSALRILCAVVPRTPKGTVQKPSGGACPACMRRCMISGCAGSWPFRHTDGDTKPSHWSCTWPRRMKKQRARLTGDSVQTPACKPLITCSALIADLLAILKTGYCVLQEAAGCGDRCDCPSGAHLNPARARPDACRQPLMCCLTSEMSCRNTRIR
jgi:hypothetical protein